MDKFDGKAENWKEWHYQFIVAAHAYKDRNGALLEAIEKLELDAVDTEDIDLELERKDAECMTETKAEMFGVLCLLTSGEANVLVRSEVDKNGYTTWKRLFDRYNPRTPASLTAAWREVIRPKKIKDMREASKTIDTWEGKIAVLKKEHSEEPTQGLKASLLLEMLPDHVQLTVAQGMSSKKLDYDALKAKIKLMANVQIDYSTPKPMEIGELDLNHEDEWVDVVGAQKGKGKGKGPMYGSCWTCGGSHFSRDCPKGGGKKGGGKGDNKGKGKSAGPMYGSCWTCGGNHFSRDCPNNSDGKGKGKGKGIKCYTCGGVGHRQEQCPTAVGEVMHEHCGDDAVQGVDEDWGVFSLQESVNKKVHAQLVDLTRSGRGMTGVRPSWGRRWGPRGPAQIEVANRFAVLGEDADEKEWIQKVGEEQEWKLLVKGTEET